jgi:hypothetical protein
LFIRQVTPQIVIVDDEPDDEDKGDHKKYDVEVIVVRGIVELLADGTPLGCPHVSNMRRHQASIRSLRLYWKRLRLRLRLRHWDGLLDTCICYGRRSPTEAFEFSIWLV